MAATWMDSITLPCNVQPSPLQYERKLFMQGYRNGLAVGKTRDGKYLKVIRLGTTTPVVFYPGFWEPITE